MRGVVLAAALAVAAQASASDLNDDPINRTTALARVATEHCGASYRVNPRAMRLIVFVVAMSDGDILPNEEAVRRYVVEMQPPRGIDRKTVCKKLDDLNMEWEGERIPLLATK